MLETLAYLQQRAEASRIPRAAQMAPDAYIQGPESSLMSPLAEICLSLLYDMVPQRCTLTFSMIEKEILSISLLLLISSAIFTNRHGSGLFF